MSKKAPISTYSQFVRAERAAHQRKLAEYSKGASSTQETFPVLPPEDFDPYIMQYRKHDVIDYKTGARDKIENELEIGTVISRSAFHTVARARYQGVEVAVKISTCAETRSFLATEVNSLRQIQALSNHSTTYCIQLVADVLHGAVFKYYPAGDLETWINQRKNPIINMKTREHFLRQIVEGVHFLHGLGVHHRDLKANNILIDSEDGRVKIADFGCAEFIDDDDFYYGAIRYQSPQILRVVGTEKRYEDPTIAEHTKDAKREYTEKDEMYSLALLAYHLFLGVKPYEHFGNLSSRDSFLPFFMKIVVQNMRPVIPGEFPLKAKIYTLISFGWSNEPERRPDFNTALDLTSIILGK